MLIPRPYVRRGKQGICEFSIYLPYIFDRDMTLERKKVGSEYLPTHNRLKLNQFVAAQSVRCRTEV